MRPSRKRTRRLLARYKVFVGCLGCGYRKSARALDFHHRPGEIKLFGLSDGWKRYPAALVRAEVRKCDVLCRNCHAEHHEEHADASDVC